MCETAASAGQIVVGTTTSEAFRRGDREPHRRKGDLPSLMGSAVVRWSERISILYSYGDPLGTYTRLRIAEELYSGSCAVAELLFIVVGADGERLRVPVHNKLQPIAADK